MRCRLLPLALAALLAPSAAAQAPRRTLARNVVAGALVSVDAAAGLVTVRPRVGGERAYRLAERTWVLRTKKRADIAAFKPGDEVVVRFRPSSAGPPLLYDLADRPTWEWLDRIRHETTLVIVKDPGEDLLRAEEGADAAPVEYRVTERTLWSKSGKPAGPGDWKAGDRAWVAPRLLPSGATMALAVSDTPQAAAVLTERTRVTVTGAVRAVSAADRTLSLHTRAGDERSLRLAPECLVRRQSRDVPLSEVRVGQTVTTHLRRGADGEREVTRITIQAGGATRRTAGRAPKP